MSAQPIDVGGHVSIQCRASKRGQEERRLFRVSKQGTVRCQRRMQANEIMTSNVTSVRDESSIEDAARLLARHRISGLPVVNGDGKLIGLVTEHDLIAKGGATVADIMSRSVISVSPDTPV